MEGYSDANIQTDPVKSAACPKCGAMLDVDGLAPFTAVQCPACEFEFQVPARFGNFMLLQLLGAGGMGGVYRARDEGLNREVAIKVMLKSLGDDPQFVETFQREAQAAAKLNHPNIAQIFSFGQEKGQPYISMELVSGGSLDRMMAAQGPLDPAAAIYIGAQVAEGLREAAEAGLVHGDVKPENILFDNDKNAKLVDFGLASMACGPGNDVWGTPYYIAPEKVRRQKSDFRSDIYSLGGTLYHAITGVPPFEGEDATAVVKARFDGPPKPMGEIRGKVPEEVEQLIARMLAVEPQTRYPTYGSLLGDMRRFLSKAGPVKLAASSKKIMIKNKRAGGITGQMSTAGLTGAAAKRGASLESEGAAGKRGCKMMALIVGGGLLLVLLVAGGVIGGKVYMTVKKAKAEFAQAVKSQESARASIAKSVTTAKITVERIRAYVPEALEYAKAATDLVAAALGEDVRAGMVPPEPDYADVLPVAAETNGVAAATNVVAAETNGVAAVAAASNAVPVAAAEPASVAPAAVAPAVGETPPLVAAVRKMYEEAYAVNKASLLADRLLAEVESQAKVAEGLMVLGQADALFKLVNALADKVNNLPFTKGLAEVPRQVSQLKKSVASIKADSLSLAEARRQEALDKERKLKAEEALEKKRLEQEAQKEKAKGELDKVTAAEGENVTLLKQLKFREVARTLEGLKEEVATPAAKAAVDLALERVSRVKDFHTYLVEKSPGFKSSRGWVIDSADQKVLSVAGKKISWPDVYASHLDVVADLIKGLVMDEQATKSLRVRERTRLMTNAALCLTLFYKENMTVQERAKKLAADAVQLFEVDADSVKRLLPEFF